MPPYLPFEYAPDLFNSLPLFEDARRQLTKERVQKDDMSTLRELFRKYSVHSTFGLIMLHRHFSLDEDEKLIEYRGVSTPWKVGASAPSIFGGRIVPRCWAFFSDDQLHPTEFRFAIPGDHSQVPEFPAGFVTEFHEFVSTRGLAGLLGLTVFDAVVAIDGMREVERTVGRVSVTIPVDEETIEGTETAWTFGCHERMDDSELMNARICWVCQGCK